MMELRRRRGARLIPFDKLQLKKREEDTGISHWVGQDGAVWVVKPTTFKEPNRPVAQMFRDRQYWSGLFKSYRPDEYLADVRNEDGTKRQFRVRLWEDTGVVLERVLTTS